jgi:hypothetical protein
VIRRIGPILLLLSIGALTGACKSAPDRDTLDRTTRTVKGLPKSSDEQIGLELVTWHVDETALIDETLDRYAGRDERSPEFRSLDRNAVVVIRLQEAQLPELLGSIGGVNASMSTWCGQVTEWRPLRDIRFKRNLLMVDGRTTLLDGGKLALAARAWVEPTLEGARMHLEFVPRFQADRGQYASLLKRTPPKMLVFDGLAEQTDLLPGEVLLVTCSSLPSPPETEPEPVNAPAGDDPDPSDDPSLDTKVPGTQRIKGSIELGHTLFSLGGEAPERIILILTPRIPPNAIPGNTNRRAGTAAEIRS